VRADPAGGAPVVPLSPALSFVAERPQHAVEGEQDADAPDQEEHPDDHHHDRYNEWGISSETPERVEMNRTADST